MIYHYSSNQTLKSPWMSGRIVLILNIREASRVISFLSVFLSIQCCVIRNSLVNLISSIETCSRRLNNPELAAHSIVVRTYIVYQSHLWRRTLIAVKLLPVYHMSTLQTCIKFCYRTSQNNRSNYKHWCFRLLFLFFSLCMEHRQLKQDTTTKPEFLVVW